MINLFKTKKNFKKKHLELNPGFYWKLIIGVTFVLIFFSFLFGYYVFSEVKKDSISPLSNVIKKQPIEKERLDKVLEYFSAREKKSAQILNSPSPVVDPSL